MPRFLGRAFVLATLLLVAGSARAKDKEVTIAYQDMWNPWRVSIASGELEKATGWKINWRLFTGGADVIRALASGDVAIGEAGSSPIAAGLSQGIDVELFWILEDIASAEALVVRNGSGITEPRDLRGKRIATPFVSTSHYHLLFALEQFGIRPGEAQVVNLRPPEIAAAWERGDIDAAFVWDPALSRIQKTGKVLLTSGLLSGWGKPTFDGIVVSRKFARENPEFVVAFVKAIASADERYRQSVASWTAGSAEVKAIAKVTGGKPEDIPAGVALYRFPTLQEQASPRWLGGGKDGGAARALGFTAQFLKDQGRIQQFLPDYSTFVNPEWIRRAQGEAKSAAR
jgi:taurine transport system substrate-binding protein